MRERLLALLILWCGAFARWIWKGTAATTEEERIEKPLHDHERTDVHVLGVAIVLASLGAFLVLAALLPKVLLPLVAHETRRPYVAVERFSVPPEPRLQSNPIVDLARRRDAEMHRLEQGEDGSMPIERAMAMIAAGAIPVRSGPATPPQQPLGYDAVESAESITSGRFVPGRPLIANTPGNVPEGRP